MEKERKFKTIGIVAVLVAIIGLSIAFAALSRTLSINGTAKQESSTWQVVWEKISGEDFVTTGTAEVQDNYPTLTENDTNLNLGIITLKKPGDKVTYRVNMANKGTIDAKVTGVTGVSLDNTYVSYSVKYLDNNIDITAANGRLLAANQRKMVLIEVKFKESVTTEQFNQIPQAGITVDLNGVEIQYSQNDGSADATDPENEVEKRYNISVKDLTNIDFSVYGLVTGEEVAYGFEDSNEVLHAFTFTKADDNTFLLIYSPDPYGSLPIYLYDGDKNNWMEVQEDEEGHHEDFTGNTINTDSLIFNNVRLATDEVYEQFDTQKFTSQMINDMFNITQVE